MAEYEQGPTGDIFAHGVGFGAQSPPPGYRIDQSDSGHYYWVRLIDGGPDYDLESDISWDKWAGFRGAWSHSRRTP